MCGNLIMSWKLEDRRQKQKELLVLSVKFLVRLAVSF